MYEKMISGISEPTNSILLTALNTMELVLNNGWKNAFLQVTVHQRSETQS